MTAVARLQQGSHPGSWAASLAMASVGNLAMMAGTPLAVVIAWTAIDTFELTTILANVPKKKSKIEAIIAFFARMAGTMVLIFAMIMSKGRGLDLILVDPGPEIGVFILIAVGLRLGVLPLHMPYTEEVPLRRGLGLMLRLTSPLASLMLLARLPMSVVPVMLSPLLMGFASLAALYGSIMWLASSQEIRGRPYWLIAIAGMAVASSIRGYPLSSLAWAINLALTGGILFLYTFRSRKLHFIPLVGTLFSIGIPFTPAASGWFGLVVIPLNIPDFLFLLAQILLVIGYAIHATRENDIPDIQERWIQSIYPVGLIMIMFSGLLVSILGWEGSLSPGVWWVSLLTALICGFIYWRITHKGKAVSRGYRIERFLILGKRIGSYLTRILDLSWFYKFLQWTFRRIQVAALSISAILEGQGGILWVFVLLALILSISMAGGS